MLDVGGSEKAAVFGVRLVQAVIGYEWLMSGYEKIVDPAFLGGIPKTLAYFASKNPYSWYRAYLEGSATQYAGYLGYAVVWGELLAGIGLIVAACATYARNEMIRKAAACVSVCALIGGLLMSANFFFAAGWTGPGTKGMNVVMFWTQLALLYVWVASCPRRKQPAE